MLKQLLFQSVTKCRVQLLRSTVRTLATEAEFQQAKDTVPSLKEDPGNEAKLKLYALFKQATSGACDTKRPGMMDFVGRAKWDAWNALGSISKDDAMDQYVSYVQSLIKEHGIAGEASTGSSEEAVAGQPCPGIDFTVQDSVATIKWNRPQKKNAITVEMYETVTNLLKTTASDSNVKIVVFTGEGDFYCSGNDLGNFTSAPMDDLSSYARKSGDLLQRFVGAFIDFPKPLIGLINGPAYGVSVTTLGLFDAVYMSDKAFFHTPFTSLGQSAEGCSSYTFPKLMGMAKASELLLFNKKITAHEACERNLVTAVLPHESFHDQALQIVQQAASPPPQSLMYGKQLIREKEREILHEVNRRECERLVERWQSEECMNAVMKFFSKS